MYLISVLLLTGVVFVNGWTDAPNAIACVVSTGALPYRKAVRLAALCNLAGILVMSAASTAVADTIGTLVRLEVLPPEHAAAIVCAALCAIVLFAVGAWAFGIPTSESHALIAALTGAALAAGSVRIVSGAAWVRVLWGLLLSLALGFGLGWLATKCLGGLLRRCAPRTLGCIQVLSGAFMAFMHGAQDGQKFIAVFLLLRCLSRGEAYTPAAMGGNTGLPLACALVMALGTLVGGKRIIDHVGGDMVRLRRYQGACADLGGALCLLAASLFGIPMSTTHTKTTAMMGAGKAVDGTPVDRGAVGGMFFAWVVTFPVCGGIGYLAAALLLRAIG